MTALRISAILSILVAAFYVQGAITLIRYGGPLGGTIWLALVGVAVPLVPGVLALFARSTFLLPAAWGWALGVHLPKLMMPRPQIPAQFLNGPGANLVVRPDYFGMVIVAVAVVGLALYGVSYYRSQHPPAP